MKTITTTLISFFLLVIANTTAGAATVSFNNETSNEAGNKEAIVSNSINAEKPSDIISKDLSIRFTSPAIGNAVIRLQSVTGQQVASKNITINKGTNTIELGTLNGLSKGLYFAQVVINGVVVDNQRVIKN